MDELMRLAQGIIDTADGGHAYPSHALRALEDEIERRDVAGENERIHNYIHALFRIVGAYPDVTEQGFLELDPMDVWALIRATPEQRARAFLEAMQ